MIVTHKKGKHRSTPYKLRVGKYKKLQADYIFDLNAAYDLGNNDQFDWNKLTGFSFELLKTTNNSAMVGWRYNVKDNLFEFCAYCHVSGERIFTLPLFRVKPNNRFTVEMRIADGGVYFTFTDELNTSSYYQPFKEQNKCVRLISAWFGGNNAAPNEITFSQNLKLSK